MTLQIWYSLSNIYTKQLLYNSNYNKTKCDIFQKLTHVIIILVPMEAHAPEWRVPWIIPVSAQNCMKARTVKLVCISSFLTWHIYKTYLMTHLYVKHFISITLLTSGMVTSNRTLYVWWTGDSMLYYVIDKYCQI